MGVGTSWVAIDHDGSIGVLDAGANGLAPRGTLGAELFALDALRAARALALGKHPRTFGAPRVGRRVLVLVDPARAALASYRSAPRRSTFEQALGPDATVVREAAPGVLATAHALTAERAALLARDPTVVLALDEDDLRRWLHDEPDTGVFRWAVVGDDPARYERARPPAAPIRIYELPEATQHAIRSIRFRARFSRETTVFVDEHFRRDRLTTAVREPVAPTSDRAQTMRIALALGAAAIAHVLAWLAIPGH